MLCTSNLPVFKLFEFGEGALVNESLDEGLVLLLWAVTHVHACRLTLLHILFHKLLKVRLEARQRYTTGYRHLVMLQLLASGLEAMQNKNHFSWSWYWKPAIICATARVGLQVTLCNFKQVLHPNDRLVIYAKAGKRMKINTTSFRRAILNMQAHALCKRSLACAVRHALENWGSSLRMILGAVSTRLDPSAQSALLLQNVT